MSKNQTSIEWLINELQEKFTKQINDIYNSNQLLFEDLVIKAKAMHKEEIMEAQSIAISNADMTNNRGYFDCEQYYNKTFNTDK